MPSDSSLPPPSKRWLVLAHAFNMDGRAASQTITDKLPHLCAAGIEVVVGNAATGEVLRAANIVGARDVVIAIPNAFEAGQATEQCRKLNSTVKIIARAHAHGIKVYGATLTPYRGAHYFMEDGEKVREAYNQWIKTGGAFDGVVDFAPAVADKADPTTFNTGFNLTDKLHPNDAGYQAMADAIDLSLLK